jgi:hypothetical protein
MTNSRRSGVESRPSYDAPGVLCGARIRRGVHGRNDGSSAAATSVERYLEAGKVADHAVIGAAETISLMQRRPRVRRLNGIRD